MNEKNKIFEWSIKKAFKCLDDIFALINLLFCNDI